MSVYQKEKSNKICYVVTIPLTIRAFFIPQLKYLAENGMDVSVVCSSNEKLQKELGEKVRFIPITIPRGMSVLGMVKAIVELRKLFRKERFDLIQYSTPNAALCAVIAGKLAGIRLRNYHLMGFRYLGAGGIGKIILKTLERITCSLSTSIECVSNSNLELGVQEGIFPRDKATVVWNGSSGGVDLQRFDFSKRESWRKEIRQKIHYAQDDFVFGFVGRITRDKGVNEILEAFSYISFGKLLLVGSEEGVGTLDQDLLEQARKNPNITFYGSVTDVEKYYAAIDVLLLPSYREGFGNVVIEAGAVGTPSIVSDIPGPIDTIERNNTALVVPVKNVEALATAMKQVCGLNYTIMGQNAAKFAKEKFDSRVQCQKILERKRFLLR